MAKILSTVWAFLLHIIGVSIFQTCFANSMEDMEGETLLTGPPITSFVFAFGVYIIILKTSLFPETYKKPQIALLSIYEFLATAFLLEFSMACVWTPIDIIIMTTLPKKICQMLVNSGFLNMAEWVNTNKILMQILCYVTAFGFFLISLYVTRSLDFDILRQCGMAAFGSHIKNVFWKRLKTEIPTINQNPRCNCGIRRTRSRDSTSTLSDSD